MKAYQGYSKAQGHVVTATRIRHSQVLLSRLPSAYKTSIGPLRALFVTKLELGNVGPTVVNFLCEFQVLRLIGKPHCGRILSFIASSFLSGLLRPLGSKPGSGQLLCSEAVLVILDRKPDLASKAEVDYLNTRDSWLGVKLRRLVELVRCPKMERT
ncbi:MAG: hypothetical protein ACLP5H_29820 [Desulfomonilaceae bacterium]